MSQELLEKIVGESPDCIASLDKTLTFISVNRSYQEHFWKLYGRELAAGDNLKDVLAGFPLQLALVEEIYARALTGESVQQRLIRGSAGGQRTYDVVVFPLRDAEGRVTAVVETGRDITPQADRLDSLLGELHAAERALDVARGAEHKANVDVRNAAQAKAHFLAALSHDLRQPAQALSSLSYLLAERSVGTPVADLARPIEHACTALGLVLDAMLDISRLDAGKIEVREVPLTVEALLRRLAVEFVPRAATNGQCLRYVGSTATVTTDPLLLERILRHFLENALRFTPSGQILLGCRHRGRRLAIEVIDTGLGIPDSERDAIFDDFYQLGNAARDRALGLGVGLAVVRRLAQLLGAELELTSEPGRGSRFAILLPKTQHPSLGLAEDSAVYQIENMVAAASLMEKRRPSGLASARPWAAGGADPRLTALAAGGTWWADTPAHPG
jgi:two-component system, sensor histidine kinase